MGQMMCMGTCENARTELNSDGRQSEELLKYSAAKQSRQDRRQGSTFSPAVPQEQLYFVKKRLGPIRSPGKEKPVWP